MKRARLRKIREDIQLEYKLKRITNKMEIRNKEVILSLKFFLNRK